MYYFCNQKKSKDLTRKIKIFKLREKIKGDAKRKSVCLTHPQGSGQDVRLEIRKPELLFCSVNSELRQII